MNVRSQVSMVFHLDKCIGCHTCSISCKNIWTDRKGAEYMWWNNVETKPGTGYPTLWEDQKRYRGGWVRKNKKLQLKLQGRLTGLANIFFNPYLPTVDDYYEPWTYQYEDLFKAPETDDQPTARPISRITGKPIDIKAGPNWDDDLGGSNIYAANDPNLEGASKEERTMLFELEKMVFFYVPRICNHCLNPGCIGACPAGAIYKRGEDGIVLVSQEKCRGWRMCVSGCPYKKVYFNWGTGKSEKCILCYPRLETGQAPACFHSCVGRIRYVGILLYDADRLQEVALHTDNKLVEAQRDIILDPADPNVVAQARRSGVHDSVIDYARRSPVYRWVKEFQMALPLHPEFRTIPMLFYVPPLLPVMASMKDGVYASAEDFFSSVNSSRVSTRYLASLFTGGNESIILDVYRKLAAVRIHKRSETVKDIPSEKVEEMLNAAELTPKKAEEIFRLTSLVGFEDRFVLPPFNREMSIESTEDPQERRRGMGLGFNRGAKRRW